MSDLLNIDPAREVIFSGPTGVNADVQFRRPAVVPFLRPMPKKIKLRTQLDDFDSSSIDGAFKVKTLSANYWNLHDALAFTSTGINLSHDVYGVHPLGVHSEEISCGRNWVTSKGTVLFKDVRAWKHHTLLLQPASAANAANIVDRNVVAATENINQFFPTLDPKTKVTLGSDARAQVARLAGQQYELTRILWRLATLYVAKAWGEKRDLRINTVTTLSDVHVVEIRDASSWAPTLAMKGYNWIAYTAHSDSIMGPADALSVLSLAAAEEPMLVADNGETLPSIFNTYPRIPHARVLFITGYGNLARDKYNSLSAAQVWDIAVDYTLQNGDVAQLMEMVDTICGMIYAPTETVIAPFYADRVHIGLPPAEMEACVMLPLSTKSLAYGESSMYVEAPHIKQYIYDATCTAMATALAVKQVAFIAGFGFSFYRNHTTAREKIAMLHARLGVTPIMAAAERILNAIGIDGTLGRVQLHMSYNPTSFDEVWNWYDDSHALLWEEALPLIDRIPYNCAIMAKLQPLSIASNNIAIDHWYGVGVVPEAMSSVDAVNSLMLLPDMEFGWQVELPSHSQVRWYTEVRPRMANGKPSDWNHCERALVDDFVVSTVFKFKTHQAALKSRVAEPILAAMQWYIGQSDERPPPALVVPRRMYGPSTWPLPFPAGSAPPTAPPTNPPSAPPPAPMAPPPKSPPRKPKPPDLDSDDEWLDDDKNKGDKISAPPVRDAGRPTVRGNAAEVDAAAGRHKDKDATYVTVPPKKGRVSDVQQMEHQRKCDVLGWILNSTEDERVKGLCATILKLYGKQAVVQLPDEALTPDMAADLCQYIRDINWTPTFWRLDPSMRATSATNLVRILGHLVPLMKTPTLQAEFMRLKHHMEARAAALSLNPALSVGEIETSIVSLAKERHEAACADARRAHKPPPTYVGPSPNLMSALEQFAKLSRDERADAVDKMMMSGRTAIDLIARAAPTRATGSSNSDLMKKALESAEAAKIKAEQEQFAELVEMFVTMVASDNDCEAAPDQMAVQLQELLGVNDLPPPLVEALRGYQIRWAEHNQTGDVVDNWETLGREEAKEQVSTPPPNEALESTSDKNADAQAADSGGITVEEGLRMLGESVRSATVAIEIAGADIRAADFGSGGSPSGHSQSARPPEQPTPGDVGSQPTPTSAPSGGSTQTTPSSTGQGTGPAPTLDFHRP